MLHAGLFSIRMIVTVGAFGKAGLSKHEDSHRFRTSANHSSKMRTGHGAGRIGGVKVMDMLLGAGRLACSG